MSSRYGIPIPDERSDAEKFKNRIANIRMAEERRRRVASEMEARNSDLLLMIDEFDKLASIPVDPENVRGLQVSRMHFEQWRDRLRAIAGK